MPNCFVFAIGGTGSRVLRSLTHLLAAGVKPTNNFDIVPIIIDPHNSNLDLQRTENLLKFYKNVKETSGSNGFFSTAIKTLLDLRKEADIPASFTFELDGASSSFKDYIGYRSMKQENAALANLLFSGYSKDKRKKKCELLDIEMDVGFVGNPNVGSVVLNQVKDSKVYNAFANALDANGNDRIFIVSSIFGGTGAAGFPCLLKNIRNGSGGINTEVLKNAKIGAVTVLPYFRLEKDDDSPINYSDFVAKTKSALYYYKKNVTGNNSVNAMYYIGDQDSNESYKNDPGHGGQKNNAHFVELASSLAIIDFLSLPDTQLECRNGKAVAPIYREFGIGEDVPKPDLFNFGEHHKRLLTKPLSQFALFRKYMEEEYRKKMGKRGWSTEAPQLDGHFISEIFCKDYLFPFFNDFYNWLEELNTNNRGFSPFNLAPGIALNVFIKGKKIEVGFLKSGLSYDRFDDYLNKYSKNEQYKTKELKLMEMFCKATSEILEKEYKLQ